MALDYSTLSDDELKAIANDDYSTLSDATLRDIAASPAPNVGPYAGGPLAASGTKSAMAAYLEKSPVLSNLRDTASVVQNVANRVSPQGLTEMVNNPVSTAKAFVQGMPFYKYATNPSTILPALGSTAGRAIGGALAAPENIMTMPYSMAAYEQAKIRSDPNNPAYATNPYGQTIRGEYPTMGSAAAANQRQAITNMPSGYTPTPQEAQNIMQSGDQRMIGIYGGPDKLNQLIRQKAAEKVLGPIAPGSF